MSVAGVNVEHRFSALPVEERARRRITRRLAPFLFFLYVLTNCTDADAVALPAGFAATDLSLLKTFPLAGHAQFQFRADISNVFTRPNFNNPHVTFGTADFGRITSAQRMRQIVLGGKLFF